MLKRSLLLLVLIAAGCGNSDNKSRPGDAITDGEDAGTTPPAADGGNLPPPDAGGPDYFGQPGPWPTAPVTVYGSAQGLLEAEIVEASTDEAQNIWAVSRDALYLLRPGETQFRRFTAADGLNLQLALPPGITAVAGGAANEVWVGYKGAYVVDPQKDPDRFLGKLDRVRLRADGTLEVVRYNVHNNDAVGIDDSGNFIRLPDGSIDPEYTDWSFNENRTVYRFLYDHVHHRGTLYVGYNHGVGRIDADRIDPVHGFDYADHVHPDAINAEGTKRMGEWRALAVDPTARKHRVSGEMVTGGLWMGGRWAAGLTLWTPGLWEWTRNALNPFHFALRNPPVFPVASGEDVFFAGIAPLTDGTVYFASGPFGSSFTPLGIAYSATGEAPFTVVAPEQIGLPSRDILDFQRLPDDTILIALPQGLFRWDPKPAPLGTLLGELPGIPGSISRLYVDTMVRPFAVYVATDAGFAMLRLAPVR